MDYFNVIGHSSIGNDQHSRNFPLWQLHGVEENSELDLNQLKKTGLEAVSAGAEGF